MHRAFTSCIMLDTIWKLARFANTSARFRSFANGLAFHESRPFTNGVSFDMIFTVTELVLRFAIESLGFLRMEERTRVDCVCRSVEYLHLHGDETF